jgi:hypothetical protein
VFWSGWRDLNSRTALTPDIGSVSETVRGRPISLTDRASDFGGFQRQTLMVVIKVVRRIAELSESKGLNQDQKHLDFLFERPYERFGHREVPVSPPA